MALWLDEGDHGTESGLWGKRYGVLNAGSVCEDPMQSAAAVLASHK